MLNGQDAVILEAKKGIPTTPFEIVAGLSVASLMFGIGYWELGATVLAVLGIFFSIGRGKERPVLTISKESIVYSWKTNRRVITWNDISRVRLKGNSFFGRTLRVEGHVRTTISGRAERIDRFLEIPDAFGEPLETILGILTTQGNLSSRSETLPNRR